MPSWICGSSLSHFSRLSYSSRSRVRIRKLILVMTATVTNLWPFLGSTLALTPIVLAFVVPFGLGSLKQLIVFVLCVTVVGSVWILLTRTVLGSRSRRKRKARADDDDPQKQSTLLHNRVWGTLRQFLPLIWPTGNLRLQSYFGVCLLMLVAGRILNLYVPWMNKSVVDSLSDTTTPFRYDLVLLCVGLGLSHRIMDTIHAVLWSNLEQNTSLRLQTRFFSHLHSLPHAWHSQHKTNDLFSVAELGSDGLNDILEHILFSIAPAIADILITILYLSTIFSPWIGAIVIGQVLLYLAATVRLMEWKKKLHRPMNDAGRAKHQYAMDSLLNYETVKYFGNEQYECAQMSQRIAAFQKCEARVNIAGKLMDLAQVMITTAGLLVTSLVCGWLVHSGKCSVGDYFLFFSHFGQLHGLLKYFGGYYRSISRSLVNMESLVQILKEEPEPGTVVTSSVVAVIPKLIDRRHIAGHIEFRNVTFGYVRMRPILEKVSFTISGGQSLAIVSPSGEGKSTLLKLLFRFYEPWSGQILLDGHDIRDYPLNQLRSALGIVPQDTILFNDTLRKNILYGNVEASPTDVETAAKYACIHEKCVSLRDQYETQVGERGACLSGGEKLRVTLARMFLKKPQIYLLDEATSSLDSITERGVMDQLQKLAAGKTMIVVTHRLMTTMGMDKTIVLQGGSVVESGNHQSLLDTKPDGVYARMWVQQQQRQGPNKNGQT